VSDSQETTRGPSHVTEPASGAWTLVVVGSGDLRTHPLSPGVPCVIGRDPEANVQLDHHRVSRKHARVVVAATQETCTIEDLGSRNGTVLAAPLAPNQPHPLRAGDSIAIGPFTLVAIREHAAVQPASTLEIEDPLATTPSPMLVSIAKSTASVLLRGESGAGKQVLAETLHRLSGRPGRLVAINCAAIGQQLLESELFGYEKGAFTGAVAMKPGLLETAGDGTVLLDEIGDMPGELQAKLLRAVESREVMRVGGLAPIPIRARFVSATHRDLLAAVEAGEFRLDLFYRLAGVTLSIPPLRERRGRIAPLARELLAAAAQRDGRSTPAISPAAAARLSAHAWPGNVRELKNVIDRALILSADAPAIDAAHVIFDEPAGPARAAPAAPPTLGAGEEAERQRILDALAQCGGNQTRAAKLLGMARSTLVTKLSILRIARPRK
jgi:transcriptional regulator of acetoin/glycerol metabolism